MEVVVSVVFNALGILLCINDCEVAIMRKC